MDQRSDLLRRGEESDPTVKSPADHFLILISNPFTNQIRDNAVWTSLVTSLLLTTIVICVFSFLRPSNARVYAPRLNNTRFSGAQVPLGRSPWAWCKPVWKETEAKMVREVGLDAVVFLRFTRMCRNIFATLSIPGLAILVPINVISVNNTSVGDVNVSGGVFSKTTPQLAVGKRLWNFVVAAYISNSVCCIFLWINYRAIRRLQRQYFESYEYRGSLRARTLLISGISERFRTDAGIVSMVEEVKTSRATPQGIIARDVGNLPKLFAEHEAFVRALEKALVSQLKTLGKVEQNISHAGSIQGVRTVAWNQARILRQLARIEDLEGKIKHGQLTSNQRSPLQYGFAIYQDCADADAVVRAGRPERSPYKSIRFAPYPSDIIWSNLDLNTRDLRIRRWATCLWVVLLTVFWTCFNALLAVFVSDLANLGLVWETFDDELHRNPKVWAAIQGIAAPTITSLFYYILPSIFRRLTLVSGCISKAGRERHVISLMYAFFVFNNLIVFSLFSALWQYVVAVIHATKTEKNVLVAVQNGAIWTKLLYALCTVSPFWITWLLQRNLGAAIDLAQLAALIWYHFARRFKSLTPREVIRYSSPRPFDYASYYSYFLFYCTVALCFSFLQPLILPVTAFYFTLDSWLKKYLILYVFITKHESNGVFWRTSFDRFLFAMFLSQLPVIFLVAAKGSNSWLMLSFMVPLPCALVGFKIYCLRTFDNQDHLCSRSIVTRSSPTTRNDGTQKDNITSASRLYHSALCKTIMIPMVPVQLRDWLLELCRDRSVGGNGASITKHSDMHERRKAREYAQAERQIRRFDFVQVLELNVPNENNRDHFEYDRNELMELYAKPGDGVSLRTDPIKRNIFPAKENHTGLESSFYHNPWSSTAQHN